MSSIQINIKISMQVHSMKVYNLLYSNAEICRLLEFDASCKCADVSKGFRTTWQNQKMPLKRQYNSITTSRQLLNYGMPYTYGRKTAIDAAVCNVYFA